MLTSPDRNRRNDCRRGRTLVLGEHCEILIGDVRYDEAVLLRNGGLLGDVLHVDALVTQREPDVRLSIGAPETKVAAPSAVALRVSWQTLL